MTLHVATVCEVPVSLITLVDAERQWFKSRFGLGVSELPRDTSFCGHTILGREILEIPDALEDKRFHDNPLVVGEPNFRFYAGVPLTTPDGHNIGTLAVIDRVPRLLTAEQRDALVRSARQVVEKLELRKKNHLLDANESLQKALLNNAGSSIIVTTPDGAITHFNPGAEQMFGYSSDEVIGEQYSNLGFHDEAEIAVRAKELTREFGRSIRPGRDVFIVNAQRGKSERREWTCVRKNGTCFRALLSVTAIRDDHANVIGYLGISIELPSLGRAAAQDGVENTETISAAPAAIGVAGVLTRTLWLAVAYLALSGIGWLVASSGGYGSPFWPAAGLAVGVLLVWGWRYWPGVWLGSFVFSFLLELHQSGLPGLGTAAYMAPIIATGAALQAAIGAQLARRVWRSPNVLVREGDVFWFLVLVGPLVCTISPTLGVVAPWLAGRVVSGHDFFIYWFNWWGGDSIGVMLFAPLVLLGLPESRGIWRDRLAHIVTPLLTTALLFSVVIIWLERNAELTAKYYADEKGEEVRRIVTSHLPVYAEEVRMLERLFASSVSVTRDEFSTFASRTARQPEFQAMQWVPRVPQAQRAAVERAARREGFGEFQINEWDSQGRLVRAGTRAEYFPIFFVEPLASNRPALGFDMSSQKYRLNAMKRARDTGDTVASEPIELVQSGEMGVILIRAVYHARFDTISATSAARRENLRGFVVAVLNMRSLASSLLEIAQSKKLHIRVLDIPAGAPAQTLIEAGHDGDHPVSVDWSEPLEFGGRQWRLEVGLVDEHWLHGLSGQSPLFLPISVGVVLLIVVFTLANAGRAIAITREVSDRTSQLSGEIEVRQAIECELRAAKDDAETANKAKSQFLASMSHEIRTPLNAIVGNLELLQMGEVDDEQVEMIDAATSASKSLLALIGNILDFSKIEAGNWIHETTDVDIVAILKDAVIVLRSRAVQKGISLTLTAECDVPKIVHCDGPRIRQILLNLIGNAVKFTEKGGVHVNLSVTDRGKDLCELRFVINDSGKGFDNSMASGLFDPFVQDDTDNWHNEGTGLGLSISRTLLENFGGTIGCNSIPGEGATFWFTLPAAVVTSATPPATLDLSDRTILIEGDPTGAARWLKDYFRTRGANVTSMQDLPDSILTITCKGEREQDSFRNATVISDITQGHGPETVRQQETQHRLPVIYGPEPSPQNQRLAMRAGFVAVIPKGQNAEYLDLNIMQLMGGTPIDRWRQADRIVSRPPFDPALQRKRVLVLEDRLVNQAIIRKQLRALGVTCRLVSNGIEGLEVLENDDFDLILCDCSMPEMNGFDFTRALRRKENAAGGGRRIPVIALTANAFREDAEECLEAGMDDFISKPETLGRIAAVLGKWIGDGRSAPKAPAEGSTDAPVKLSSIDVNLLAEIMATSEVTELHEILSEFLPAARASLADVKAAISTSDANNIAAAAHGAKGEAQGVAAGSLAKLYEEMERLARGGDISELNELEERAVMEVHRVEDFIRRQVKVSTA
ncbi:Sensor histidine kinase RcsC [Oceanibacterium hippocampi]|uniref:histidine kinase n=1 Tax=Oceanibacterium hippocampi TaxID=745714 RepID=A0A1Y5TVK3_9PROT|nr:Sensor histidine kinase RcsC [Oceanibacterium hippocampi]